MKKLLCCGCKDRFPADTMIKIKGSNFHSYDCATSYAREKGKKLRAKKDKKEHIAAKKRLKDNDRKFQIKKTQTLHNKYVRIRDRSDCCISCGRGDNDIIYLGVGGKWDCGHYLTIGAHPELRFELLNSHKQCKKCNGGAGNFSKKDHTVMKEYRLRLIKKIGLDQVEWLEGPHDPKKFTIPELKELQQHYKQLIKELEQ